MAKMTIQQQADKVIEIAERSGVQSNFFFITTFKRYQVQMQVLSRLEKIINETETLVTKEYVKGRENMYTNPAINEYNKCATSANNTCTTLINIIERLRPKDEESKSSLTEMMQILMGD